MNDILSIFLCCNQKTINSQETLINHIPTQKIKDLPNSHKVLEEKKKIHQKTQETILLNKYRKHQ